MRASLAASILAAASLGVGGCGGGGNDSPYVTIAILSTGSLDGFVTATGTVNSVATVLSAGDDSTNDTARLFVSFPLGAIPPGAVIQSASLELRQVAVLGTPYADLGALVIDHMDYGATLDFSDFGAGALSTAFAVFASTPVLEWKTLEVKPEVDADIAAFRTRSQFRCRFGAATDGFFDDDYASFASNEAAADKPVLWVTYLP